MRFTLRSTVALLAAASYVHGQTYTSCNPTKKSCPANPALGKTIATDFTQGLSDDWEYEDGTEPHMTYNSDGANFVISDKGQDPTIVSSKYIFFGRISATMKAAPGKSIVSAFILLSDDLDEIDWEWLGGQPTFADTNIFREGGEGGSASYKTGNTQDEWHTYSIDWTSSALTWFIDGVPVRTVHSTDSSGKPNRHYPQTPMRVKIGNWIGCADAAAVTNPATAGTCGWSGGPVDWTQAPFNMRVKEVTVEDYSCAREYVYGDRSGDWQSIQSVGSCNKDTTSVSAHHSSTEQSSTASSAVISTSDHPHANPTTGRPASISTHFATGPAASYSKCSCTSIASVNTGLHATATTVSTSFTTSPAVLQHTTHHKSSSATVAEHSKPADSHLEVSSPGTLHTHRPHQTESNAPSSIHTVHTETKTYSRESYDLTTFRTLPAYSNTPANNDSHMVLSATSQAAETSTVSHAADAHHRSMRSTYLPSNSGYRTTSCETKTGQSQSTAAEATTFDTKWVTHPPTIATTELSTPTELGVLQTAEATYQSSISETSSSLDNLIAQGSGISQSGLVPAPTEVDTSYSTELLHATTAATALSPSTPSPDAIIGAGQNLNGCLGVGKLAALVALSYILA